MRMRMRMRWTLAVNLVCVLLAIAGCCGLVGAGNPAEAGFINWELRDADGAGRFELWADPEFDPLETPPLGLYGTFSVFFSEHLPTSYLEAGDEWSASDFMGGIQEDFWAFSLSWQPGWQFLKAFWVDLSALGGSQVLRISLQQNRSLGQGWLCIPDDYVIEGNTQAELYLQGQGYNIPEPSTWVLAVLGFLLFALFAVYMALRRKGWVQTRRTS